LKKRICVFCGSSDGKSSEYREKAKELGVELAKQDIGLVYGGASIGVMGAVADACLEAGGEVIGVIPQSILDIEVGHDHLTRLHVVKDMHERKAKMYELSDGFFTIPGGMGTLDELCEIVTWSQLGYHNKPCYVINQNGFFTNLLNHFRHANAEGFLSDEHLDLVREFSHHNDALEDFSHCQI